MKSHNLNLTSKLRRFAVGGLFAAMAVTASADPTITNEDGTFDPFGGFDWSKAGNVITTGPIISGGVVTSYYWANAIAVTDTSSNPFNLPGLAPPGSGYEYTAYAVVVETVSCPPVPAGMPCGATATFTAVPGASEWFVYYDTTPDANLVTGAGITNGDLLLQGTVTSGGGNFNIVGTGGIGVFFYQGDVTYTNSTYISPELVGTTAVATLQFGSLTTNWTAPTGQPGPGGSNAPIAPGTLAFQADGNQSFTARSVPEPSTLLLLSGALLGLAVIRRKGSAKA